MVPSYIEKTKKDLSKWLGFLGYFRYFIKDFSVLTHEMSAQNRKKSLEWTTLMEYKFQKIKEPFQESPLRAAPD